MPRIPTEIKELANELQRDLNRLTDQRKAAVLDIIAQSRERLEAELALVSPESFRAQQARIALVLSESAAGDLEGGLEEYLVQVANETGNRAALDAVAEMDQWLDYYGHEARMPNVGALASYTDEILIERFAPSLARYGKAMARSIATELATAQFERASREALTDRIQGVIERERWQAERIVRTEIQHSYNASHHGTLKYAKGSGIVPGLQKTCVVTYDARTAADSLPLDGQVKDLDEMFVDGAGRRYLHPPGRPNDREKEVPWMEDEPPRPEDPQQVMTMAERDAGSLEEDVQRNIARERLGA